MQGSFNNVWLERYGKSLNENSVNVATEKGLVSFPVDSIETIVLDIDNSHRVMGELMFSVRFKEGTSFVETRRYWEAKDIRAVCMTPEVVNQLLTDEDTRDHFVNYIATLFPVVIFEAIYV